LLFDLNHGVRPGEDVHKDSKEVVEDEEGAKDHQEKEVDEAKPREGVIL